MKHVVSDPVDLTPQLMEAFKMGCRFQWCVLARSDWHDRAFSDYQQALRLAMENDCPHEEFRRAQLYYERGVHLPLAANIT